MGKHFVPQWYLRNFQDPNRPGFIWLHDRRGGLARPAEIAHVAQTRLFYDEKTEDYLTNEVERPGNVVIGKLIKQAAITLEERSQLARYVAVMIKRVPASRRHAAGGPKPKTRQGVG